MRYLSVVLLLVTLGSPAFAQSPDFLFDRPRVSVGIRGSLNVARAGSDWYDFVSEHLTVERRDFRSTGIGADVGVLVTPRFEAVFGADYAARTTPSEYRHFVDNDRFPILQSTRLQQTSLTGGLRFVPLGRGREISSLAWVPRRWTPYVGAGGGAVYYGLRQEGDFVDTADLSIFTDILDASGWAPVFYVNGGTDIRLARHVYLALDARYQWAETELRGDWIGFEPLDLSGVRVSAGINLLF